MKTVILERHENRQHRASFRLQRLQHEQQHATHMERRFLKVLHWMHCPKCGHELASEREGPVVIDVCPSCGGIWLDANDLKAIVTTDSSCLLSLLRFLREPAKTKESNGNEL